MAVVDGDGEAVIESADRLLAGCVLEQAVAEIAHRPAERLCSRVCDGVVVGIDRGNLNQVITHFGDGHLRRAVGGVGVDDRSVARGDLHER